MEWLYSFYIGTSIFGIGVTIIDFLGLLGHHDSDSAGEVHDSGDVSGHDHSLDSGSSNHDSVMDSSHDVSSDSNHDAVDSDGHGNSPASKEGHDLAHENSGHGKLLQSHKKNNPLLKILSILRYFVYFSMGFGPIGLISLATGSSFVGSLAWSLPTGVFALIITSFIKRLQTRTLDSQITESDLLMEQAEIIVPIEAGKMGKVRILLGSSHVERYARAADPKAAYGTGKWLRVTDIEKEFVIVSDE
ncbi:MAG: hypothetical protein JXR70_16790 [Spirochaetales bacterium]|nr:hypothetical protein [Spirochaetales bacterium]